MVIKLGKSLNEIIEYFGEFQMNFQIFPFALNKYSIFPHI